MESHILNHQNDRSQRFQPNEPLNELILKLRDILEPVQLSVNSEHQQPRYPILLIMGNPRSGTTLLTQWLASMGCFSYPTNLLSRLAFAPYIGAMIQKMLYDPKYDFRGEMCSQPLEEAFHSDIGKTTGPTSVSEFFHFWRKFFPNHDPGYLTSAELQQVRTEELRKELASIEAAFEKPFISKGMMMQYNIPFFAGAIPEFFFLHIERDPIHVMQSVLLSKRRYYVDDSIWWSVKPRNFEQVKDLSPYHQVAGQLLGTLESIKAGLRRVEDDRQLTVSYEKFCDDPGAVYSEIHSKYGQLGYELPEYASVPSFNCTNVKRVDDWEWTKLQRAYAELSDIH